MRIRVTLTLVVAMTLVAGLAASGCSSSAKPIPTPTSASPSTTMTLVVPRSDGIYVSDVGNAVVGYRFLPETGVVLYAIEMPGTSAQQLKSDLTPENVLNNRGNWGVGLYDAVGNLCFMPSRDDGHEFSFTNVTSSGLTIHYAFSGNKKQVTSDTTAYFVKF